MSSAATTSTTAAAGADGAAGDLTYSPPPPAPAPRSFLRKVAYDTFNQSGARFGLAWIVLLAFLGVAAPYLASTHPVVMKADGRWSSPMWTHLTAVDLILTAGGLALVVTAALRWTARRVTLATLVAAAVVSGPALALKTSPSTVNFQAYRDLERAGKVEFILRTLIPYSPTDRLRDMPEQRLTGPLATLSLGTVTTSRGEQLYGVITEKPDAPGGPQVTVKAATGDRTLPRDLVASIAWQPAKLTAVHWLGTETDGADLLSRMIHASRIALSIGLISTSIAVAIGVLVGGLMGYYVGKVDLLGMRLIEIFEAIPTLLVLITIMAAYGRSIYLMMTVIGLLTWTGTARFVRAEFLRLRKQDFVQAAIALGLPQPTVIYRHVLPNGLTPVLVTATFGVASAILTEAILSFLGLGLIDEPSWGQMLNQARSGGQGFVWWMAIYPGAAIFLTVFAYALIGDAMRDALDPKLRKRD
jgi:peptide/nickel transport system permease protein